MLHVAIIFKVVMVSLEMFQNGSNKSCSKIWSHEVETIHKFSASLDMGREDFHVSLSYKLEVYRLRLLPIPTATHRPSTGLRCGLGQRTLLVVRLRSVLCRGCYIYELRHLLFIRVALMGKSGSLKKKKRL